MFAIVSVTDSAGAFGGDVDAGPLSWAYSRALLDAARSGPCRGCRGIGARRAGQPRRCAWTPSRRAATRATNGWKASRTASRERTDSTGHGPQRCPRAARASASWSPAPRCGARYRGNRRARWRYSRGGREDATSATSSVERRPASGVRNSCAASAVNVRSRGNAPARRCSRSLSRSTTGASSRGIRPIGRRASVRPAGSRRSARRGRGAAQAAANDQRPDEERQRSVPLMPTTSSHRSSAISRVESSGLAGDHQHDVQRRRRPRRLIVGHRREPEAGSSARPPVGQADVLEDERPGGPWMRTRCASFSDDERARTGPSSRQTGSNRACRRAGTPASPTRRSRPSGRRRSARPPAPTVRAVDTSTVSKLATSDREMAT